ncbi:glycoside hydrolase family 15 protein [Phosphitispora sp. TUW77]|uniref:glycoside hydrolase family 15 protein n=1 Tax=Phosphitispora sp. TUW77 TaxID=3152361 RepID=UPI003AB849B3
MPRDIAIGNGSMLINFDRGLNMRDLYYPVIGLDNHILGHRNRLGVWVDGNFSWIDDNVWAKKAGYRQNSLVTSIEAVNNQIGISLEITDAVHYRKDLYVKMIRITDVSGKGREVRLFFTHDFSINETDVGDTVIYEPTHNCIIHYKRNRYFLINGRTVSDRTGEQGIFQYAMGIKRFKGAEGTWKDAEDGFLEQSPVAHGSVDSVVSFSCKPEDTGTSSLYYWIAAGTDIKDVRLGNEYVLENGAEKIIDDIDAYWTAWVYKKSRDFADLSGEVRDMFHRSLLLIRTQTDNGGAILAANDSDVLMYHRDHYSYMWTRDGALVAYAMDMAGYPEITEKFYQLCADIITEGGYFLHKYNADGTLGSSWHPWFRDGEIQIPIQEDETALVLFALGHYYTLYRNLEFIESLYPRLITKAADFLVSYRDPVTKLPLPSFDLWEERRGIFSFTTAAVYGGLKAAGFFAETLNDRKSAEKYGQAALAVRKAMEKHLYCPELGRFLRGVYPQKDGTLEKDVTLDSSLYGIFEFGAFAPDDRRVVNTMNSIMEQLWAKTNVGGIARYVDDYYFKKSDDVENVPGNPWIISTLWMAEWFADTAKDFTALAKSRDLINWAVNYALDSGVFSEQVHPYTGEDLSVSPLTWSHATFILAVEKYLNKYRQFKEPLN